MIELAKALVRIVVDKSGMKSELDEVKSDVSRTAEEAARDFKSKSKLELDGKSAGQAVAAFRADAHVAAKQVNDAFVRASGSVNDFFTGIKAGTPATVRKLQELVAQQRAFERAIVSAHGSVDAAAPAVRAQFDSIKRKVAEAKREVEDFTDEMSDVRVETQEGGVAWRGFGENMNMAMGKYGRMQMQAVALVGAFTAGIQIGTAVGKALGVEYEAAALFLEDMQRFTKPIITDLGKIQLLLWRVNTLQLGRIAQEVRDEATLRGSQFGVENQTFRFGRSGVQLGPTISDDKRKEIDEAARVDAQYRQQILTQRLQTAELSKNKAAIDAATAALDEFNHAQLLASGYTEEQASRLEAETRAYRAQKVAVEALATAEKNRSEAERLRREQEADFTQAIRGATPLPLLKRGDALTPAETIAAQQNADFAAAVAAGMGGPSGMQGMLDSSFVKPQQTAMQQMAAEWKANSLTMVDVYKTAVGEVSGLFSDVLFAGMTGKLDSLDDYFKNFLTNMRRRIAQFMAEKAVQMLLDKMASTGGTWGAIGTALGGIIKKEKGGYLTGGFQAFATGGVVSSPTLGLVGEGRYNEAVIPLPDGKSVPVVMGGRQERQELVQHMTITLGHEFMSSMRPFMQPSENELIVAIGGNILRNGQLRQIIKSTVG